MRARLRQWMFGDNGFDVARTGDPPPADLERGDPS